MMRPHPNSNKCWCNTTKEKTKDYCTECTETLVMLRRIDAVGMAESFEAYNRQQYQQRKEA